MVSISEQKRVRLSIKFIQLLNSLNCSRRLELQTPRRERRLNQRATNIAQ